MSRRFQRLILHVGQHKTGTTTLQRTLALNRAGLRRRGVLYPRLPGWADAHHALAPALLGADQSSAYVLSRLGRSPEAASRRALEGLRQVAAAADGHTLVLSSEAFFRRLPAPQVDRLAAQLAALAERVETVCYIRAPDAFYLSSLNTLIQAMRPIRPPLPDNRRAAVEGYGSRRALGLTVRAAERDLLPGGSVVDDFAALCLPGGVAALPRRPRRALNETMSAEALSLLLAYAAPGGDRRGVLSRRDLVVREAMRRADRWVAGRSRPVFRPGIAEEVLRATADLAWLRDAWDCRFPRLDYAVAGTGARIDFAAMSRIEDLCEVDPERRATLARRLRWLLPGDPD